MPPRIPLLTYARSLLLTPALVVSGPFLTACTLEAQSEHLHIVGNRVNSSNAQIQSLLDEGEALYSAIAALHPPGVSLNTEIRVELHGRFNRTSPYVDEEGTIHLWRFSKAQGGYHALFAHELVHAIGYDSLVAPALEKSGKHAGFYLEGWAEYLALLANPDKTGFPLFGFEEDVVVGHWLRQGGPTLADLRARHEELNMPCQGQSYILRASWFRHVDEVFGRETLWKLAATPEGLQPESVERILGASLEKVDADWSDWANSRYLAHPDANEQAQAYLGRMGWYQPCLD